MTSAVPVSRSMIVKTPLWCRHAPAGIPCECLRTQHRQRSGSSERHDSIVQRSGHNLPWCVRPHHHCCCSPEDWWCRIQQLPLQRPQYQSFLPIQCTGQTTSTIESVELGSIQCDSTDSNSMQIAEEFRMTLFDNALIETKTGICTSL